MSFNFILSSFSSIHSFCTEMMAILFCSPSQPGLRTKMISPHCLSSYDFWPPNLLSRWEFRCLPATETLYKTSRDDLLLPETALENNLVTVALPHLCNLFHALRWKDEESGLQNGPPESPYFPVKPVKAQSYGQFHNA